MMQNMMKIKPADIKETCENESKYHKLKIAMFSILMFGIGTTYQTYFNNLVYRSGIFQQRALAGIETFTDYRNPLDPATMSKLESIMFQPSSTWNAEWNYAQSAAQLDELVLVWSEAKWHEWETMHDGVVWFDTAGCLDGGFIGEVNKASWGWSPAGFSRLPEDDIISQTEGLAGNLDNPTFWSSETAY